MASELNHTTSLKNNLFPVFLKLENFQLLIIGGGNTAEEKLRTVLQNSPSTKITLVAERVSQEIFNLQSKFDITIYERVFIPNDLSGHDMVIVATGDRKFGAEVKQLATEKRIITNVADTPEYCDFYLSSVVAKGHLKIAISTDGKSPTLAKRMKVILEEAIPDNINISIENLSVIRNGLKGDLKDKIEKLNAATSVLANKQKTDSQKWVLKNKIIITILLGLFLLISGYLLHTLLPWDKLTGVVRDAYEYDSGKFRWYFLAGFIAQLIDGALGMAYGVTATSFLLSAGVPPGLSSASVHASEIFTSGVSGLIHLKLKNINSRLFAVLIIPGVLGATLGAVLLTQLQSYQFILQPVISLYTLFLGALIIRKAIRKKKARKMKTNNLFPLALSGGFLDSVGGGGWGPIVSSTLIAKGRNVKYTIASVNLVEFFVSIASSASFFLIMGFPNGAVIGGLVLGGFLASPIAALLLKRFPPKFIMLLVGSVVIGMSIQRIILFIS